MCIILVATDTSDNLALVVLGIFLCDLHVFMFICPTLGSYTYLDICDYISECILFH